jgi:Cu+-exporting ATPase
MSHPPDADARLSGTSDDHAAHAHDAHGTSAGAIAVDPVCGMKVDPQATAHRHEHRGRTYHFCSDRCRSKFAEHPAKYLEAHTAAAKPAVPGTIYTCPMHPEIRQVGPGYCPICGMALEPELATEA